MQKLKHEKGSILFCSLLVDVSFSFFFARDENLLLQVEKVITLNILLEKNTMMLHSCIVYGHYLLYFSKKKKKKRNIRTKVQSKKLL